MSAVVIRLATIVVLLAALMAPAAAAAAPTISGADGDVWNAAFPAPTYTITATPGSSVEWRLDGHEWVRESSPNVVVTLAPISDGKHELRAREIGGDDDGHGGDKEARRRFRVDTAPPRIEIREPRPASIYAQGQAVEARYSCSGAVSCVGSVGDGQPLPTSTAGPASLVVRALDEAGNASTADVDYTVVPLATARAAQRIALAPPPPSGPTRLPRAQRAHLLSPPAGSRITTRRPMLRWRPRARARLYNVQLFLLESGTPRKVLSAFPEGARLRVPRAKLAFGKRYLWRVWPYLAGGYTRSPIGLSFFNVVRPVRLTAAQLLFNQRIAHAAMRRVDAVEHWLDEGLTSGDLRDGGLGRTDFSARIRLSGSGVPIANGLATPRPLPPSPVPVARGPELRVTRHQLMVNQRIAQSALRRVAAVERRLADGLTGGDLRDGAITASKLAPGLSVASARDAPSAAPTRAATAPSAPRSADAVRVSDGQVLINLRISQAAARRANRLQELAGRGLTGAHFREGSIGSAKLAAELRG